MKPKNVFTKVLAAAGTLLVWFPILMTVLISVVSSIQSGQFRFDFLMPAELFLFAFIGGGLLLWTALVTRSQQGPIIWGFVVMIVLLFGGQVLAEVSGLASGATEPTGLLWWLLLASIATYSLALIELGVAGLLLLRDLFRPVKKAGISGIPTA